MELSLSDNIDNLSVSERKEYFERIRNQLLHIKSKQPNYGQDIIKRVYPLLRNYKLELQGEENVPKDSNVIFLVNHGNSHDIFTAYEALSMLNRRGSVMVATDCLNKFSTEIFNISNATLFDRRIKEDRLNSMLSISKKIIEGNDGVVFGESTWNLHPTLPMHNIRQGISKISLIAQKPIVPVIFEYVEDDGIKKSEGQLYKKCIIRFGLPVVINYNDSLISQTGNIRDDMIKMRRQIWNDYNINKDSLSKIDPLIYINHTYLKKFKAVGFTYDSASELKFLLFLAGDEKANEYTLNQDGEFNPGITEKNSILRKSFTK